MQIEISNIRLARRTHKDKLHFSTETQHKTNKRQTYKQQTTIKYPRCNNIQTNTQTRNQTQHSNNQRLRKSNCANSNTTAKRMLIRMTCLLFANWKYKHHVYQKENNDKQQLFNKNTTPDKHTAQKENKQQRLIYVRIYKQTQKKTTTQDPKYKQPKTTNNCTTWKSKQHYRRDKQYNRNKNDTNDLSTVCKF